MDASNDTQSTTRKRKGGMKPLPDELFRSFGIKLFFTESEYQKLRDHAERAGLNSNAKRLADYIRKCALNQKITSLSRVNREALIELNRIGNNLNQLALVANSTAQFDKNEFSVLSNQLKHTAQKLIESD